MGTLKQSDFWRPYTPSFSGIAAGAGGTLTLSGAFRASGKNCHVRAALSWSGAAPAVSSKVTLSLPKAASLANVSQVWFPVKTFLNGTGELTGSWAVIDTAVGPNAVSFRMPSTRTDPVIVAWSGASWYGIAFPTSGDLFFQGSYETT